MTSNGPQRAFARTCEVVVGGFVTPTAVSGVPGSIRGCVYRSDGTKVAASERFGGHGGDWLVTQNPARLDIPRDAQHLPGKAVYLGHFMGRHFGHFLTETLSTFWVFEEFEASGFDWFVFNPFTFGNDVTPFANHFLSAFGIPIDRVVLADRQSLRPDMLFVPERLLRLNAAVDPRVGWVYRRIVAPYATQMSQPSRLYLSRRHVSRKNFQRVCANEVMVERCFSRFGFQIIHPELLFIEDQLRLYANADVIAGLSGSALHNSLFMKRGATVVEIGDPRYKGARSPTQVLCDFVADVEIRFIRFRGIRFGPRDTRYFGIRVLQRELRAVFGPPVEKPPSASIMAWVKMLLEVAYLLARPTVGHVAIRSGLLGRWARRLIETR